MNIAAPLWIADDRATGRYRITSDGPDRQFQLPVTREGVAFEIQSTVPFHVGAYGLPGFVLKRPTMTPFRLFLAGRAIGATHGYHVRAADPLDGVPVVGDFSLTIVRGRVPAGFILAVR